jgi:serine/threonine protein kinase
VTSTDQQILRIEHIHSHHFIHRDLKPENILIGIKQETHILHIIDFGLSKQYRNEETLTHAPYRKYKSLAGTVRYVSLNTHFGIQQTRHDDLESLAYIFIYFLHGSLPWQHFEFSSKQDRNRNIMQMKHHTSIAELCSGLPVEFQTFLTYARNLSFDDQPNYHYLWTLFHNLFHASGYENDHLFDWCNISKTSQN